jgi:glycosyltransferase involved in cell wall biosynthesis
VHRAHDWVSLRGRVDDAGVVDAYQRAWLVASASRAEGWGMTLTEAAACATPAVASDIAGHRDAVQSGATGTLVPLDAMAAAIVDLLSDHDRRRRYGAQAAARARMLSWDDAAARHLDVIREVVEGQAPSPGR